jgi:serine/threonine protein phosphatase PrpC
MNLTLRYAARSDRGLVRDGNQDSVYAGPRLLAVADGMGGMAAGDVASSIVIAAMAPLDEDVPGDALLDVLRGSVETANQQLRETVEANPQMEGMGTTLTALLFSGTRAGLVHIGDSRAYLLRDGEFGQITKDDTYVQMLVDEGRISAEEAGSHPQRSLLTRAMDGRDLDPEYSVRPVLPGDRYLICSDGLSGVVSEETIAEAMREYAAPLACVEWLVSLALRGGGPDNITVIVADTTDEDIVEGSPIVGGAAAQDGAGATGSASEPESTPAARASALAHPSPATAAVPVASAGGGEGQPPPPRSGSLDGDRAPRHTVRNVVLLTVLLALLGGALWYGWSVTQSGYYVGHTDDGEIAVFRGVPGRVAGIDLSSFYLGSGVDIEELSPLGRDAVQEGRIEADTPEAAEEEMWSLIDREGPAEPPAGPDDPSASPEPEASPSAASPPPGGGLD